MPTTQSKPARLIIGALVLAAALSACATTTPTPPGGSTTTSPQPGATATTTPPTTTTAGPTTTPKATTTTLPNSGVLPPPINVSGFSAGVNMHCLWGGTSANEYAARSAMLDKLASVNVKWVRMDVGWRTLEQSGKGAYLDPYKSKWFLDIMRWCVSQANARGMKVLATLVNTPDWATSCPASPSPVDLCQAYVPNNPKDFYDITRALGEMFNGTNASNGRVAAWELWNEPDYVKELRRPGDSASVNTDPNVLAPLYVDRILKPGYQGIKAGDPNATVLAGGVIRSNTLWYDAVYKAGGKPYFDALNLHPYPAPGDKPPSEPCTNGGNLNCIKRLIDLRNANGDQNKKIWVTEFSYASFDPQWNKVRYPTDGWAWGVTESDQARFATDALTLLRDNYSNDVPVAFWYRDQDTSAPLPYNSSTFGNYLSYNFRESYMGLFHSDLSDKPVTSSFRNFVGRP